MTTDQQQPADRAPGAVDVEKWRGIERLTVDDLAGMIDYEVVTYINALADERDAVLDRLAAAEQTIARLSEAGNRMDDAIALSLGPRPIDGSLDEQIHDALLQVSVEWRSLVMPPLPQEPR